MAIINVEGQGYSPRERSYASREAHTTNLLTREEATGDAYLLNAVKVARVVEDPAAIEPILISAAANYQEVAEAKGKDPAFLAKEAATVEMLAETIDDPQARAGFINTAMDKVAQAREAVQNSSEPLTANTAASILAAEAGVKALMGESELAEEMLRDAVEIVGKKNAPRVLEFKVAETVLDLEKPHTAAA